MTKNRFSVKKKKLLDIYDILFTYTQSIAKLKNLSMGFKCSHILMTLSGV